MELTVPRATSSTVLSMWKMYPETLPSAALKVPVNVGAIQQYKSNGNHLCHGSSTGLSGMNSLISAGARFVRIFRVLWSHMCKLQCPLHSQFAPVLQENSWLWIIWRSSVAVSENCRMIPDELEKSRGAHCLWRNNMPKILIRKKGKAEENQERSKSAILVCATWHALQLFLLTKSNHQVWQLHD